MWAELVGPRAVCMHALLERRLVVDAAAGPATDELIVVLFEFGHVGISLEGDRVAGRRVVTRGAADAGA